MNYARLSIASLALLLSADALAQDVLIVHASSYNADVQSKLVATGRYATVDLYDSMTSTPSLGVLQGYDAILVFSDSGFSDATSLGNTVADYADGGGGVVVATFAFHAPGGGLTLSGRINTGGYLPFVGTGQSSNTGGLMAVQPAHPILSGVVSFSNGTAGFINTLSLAGGANRVAYFSDGFTELIATREQNGTRVVGLNFYPPSSDIRSDFWASNTDGDLIMANALDWTMTVSCPLGDADGDGVCDVDDLCPGFDDRADADFDGIPDGCDICVGEDSAGDTDGDGFCDDVDSCTGDDDTGDSDGDGVCDDSDLCPGGNDALDTDGDTKPDGCDPCPLDPLDDSDGDGICDSDDQCPNGDDVLDSDGDGVADGCDPCPLDVGDDSDGDGVCDSSDRCPGFPDNADTDGDTQPDGCDPCPLDNPDDTDGDGICDSDDSDSPDDAILGEGRQSLGGCMCQSAAGSAGWLPLILLPLVARRRL